VRFDANIASSKRFHHVLPEIDVSTRTDRLPYRGNRRDAISTWGGPAHVGISGYVVRPPRARREKPRVSAFTTADVPKILNLKPDLFLTFSDLQADIAATLIRHGIEVHCFNQRTISEILDMIMMLGALTGATDRAQRLAQELATSVAGVREQAARLSHQPRVYFEEWDDPMISGIAWVSELVEVAGGIDVFADRSSSKLAKDRVVTVEEVIRHAPDIIIGSWCGKKFRPERVAQRPGFDCIPAVQRAASVQISKGLTFEIRTVRDKTRTRASAIVATSSKGHSLDDNNGPAVTR
jgi:iron complex transport system substrate-binding protein